MPIGLDLIWHFSGRYPHSPSAYNHPNVAELLWTSGGIVTTYQRVGGLIPSSAAYMSTCTPDTEPQTEALLEILVEQMDCVG